MSPKSLVVIAGLVMLAVVAAAPSATAQAARTRQQQARESYAPRAHPRIEIHPRPLLYRRCEDWYVLQHRPSGTVLFPKYHCWWVRG